MLWIKRNLVLAITGGIALLCLAAGIFFVYSSVQQNKDLESKLEAQRTELNNLYNMKPFPSQSNIFALRKEMARMTNVIGQAKAYFKRVPSEKLTGMPFKAKLDDTIAAMRRKAQEGSVKIPDDFRFSFRSEQQALTLDPGVFPELPVQLAEVEAISQILFEAKINALESIRRPRITGKEVGQSDYHGVYIETNAATRFTSSPYEFTFFSFSTELAQILKGLYQANHGFIVKDILIEAIEPPKAPPKRNAAALNPASPQPPRDAAKPGGTAAPAARSQRPRPATGVPDQLETVINERLLKITLWVYVFKPST